MFVNEEKRIGKYKIDNLLSNGKFSYVYKGSDDSGNVVAMKYLKKRASFFY